MVNLSRRQTLIKIFTKYLLSANINISAIFTKQDPSLSGPGLQSQIQVNTKLTVLEIFCQESHSGTFSRTRGEVGGEWYPPGLTPKLSLTDYLTIQYCLNVLTIFRSSL